MKYIASLYMFSERNHAGFSFFRYIDHETGQTIEATVSGGESNVRGMMFELNGGDWEPRSILFVTHELGTREFDRQKKNMQHAGSHQKELAKFIKDALASENHSGIISTSLESVREQIQEDFRTQLEELPDEMLDAACQIVVDRFKPLINKPLQTDELMTAARALVESGQAISLSEARRIVITKGTKS